MKMSKKSDFNSHAHVERDTGQDVFRWWLGDFNSHAHVERDYQAVFDITYYEISTHTLTWSVSLIDQYAHVFLTFQLTRSRGA